MPRYALPLALLTLIALSASADAQPLGPKLPKDFTQRADVSVDVVPSKAKRGETVTVSLTISPKAHAWTYPNFPKDKDQSRNSVEVPESSALVFLHTLADPQFAWDIKPRDKTKPDGPKDQCAKKPVTWTFIAVVSPKATVGAAPVSFASSSLFVCDDDNCVQGKGKYLPIADFEVLDGEGKVNAADLAAAEAILKGGKPTPPPGPVAPPVPGPADPGRGPDVGQQPPASNAASEKVGTRKDAKPIDVYTAELKAIEQSIVTDEASSTGGQNVPSLWAFALTAMAWGLISLVTPCVFPMIPITVSIFLKQAHGSFRERLKLASVYSLTIITVLGASAFALLKFMAWLSTQPVTNILLAGIFVVLALSLFGMYEIALPNVIQKRLQAKQAKGGTIGTIFGALAFTVISFTCVAPFLGGFAGISAGNGSGGSLISLPTAREIVGGLAFATAFAAPFFVLALVPGLMKALPKSGGWLDSVKVVMGFLELAAALKFLRNAELGILPTTQYFTYDIVLGGWVVISAACGLYLLNVYRLPHDEEKPNIGVPRLLFALAFLGFALYLTPALFKTSDGKSQRPSGAMYAWVEAFLLPEGSEEGWGTDLKETIEVAKKSGKPIIVDFTGTNCANCKLNERNVFPAPAIQEEFQKFERVKIYTDTMPGEAYKADPGLKARKAEADANGDFQFALLKDIKLPAYATFMPQPNGKLKLLAVYDEGKINDPAKFVQFLKDAQEQAKPKK